MHSVEVNGVYLVQFAKALITLKVQGPAVQSIKGLSKS